MEGTRLAKSRVTGIGFGVGKAARRVSAGIAITKGRRITRTSTMAAIKADKARVVWVGPASAFGSFITFSVVFLFFGLPHALTIALAVAIGFVIAIPLLTGILAHGVNQDYDRRWYCDACGETWTD